jgi:hypothetical protein
MTGDLFSSSAIFAPTNHQCFFLFLGRSTFILVPEIKIPINISRLDTGQSGKKPRAVK